MTDTELEPQATPPPASTPWVPMWSLNPTGVDLRYQGDYAPGSYSDGDIVVFQGVAYLCVRPTGAAPVPWSPPQISPTYGTTLPANPVDGQEHVLVDSVTAPTYAWRFRFNAQSTSAYKWELVGGAPIVVSTTAFQAPASGAWAVGTPSITAPRAGEYDVSFSGNINANAATNPAIYGMSVSPNAGHMSALEVLLSMPVGYQGTIARSVAPITLAAGEVLNTDYYQQGSGATVGNRYLSLIARRVS